MVPRLSGRPALASSPGYRFYAAVCAISLATPRNRTRRSFRRDWMLVGCPQDTRFLYDKRRSTLPWNPVRSAGMVSLHSLSRSVFYDSKVDGTLSDRSLPVPDHHSVYTGWNPGRSLSRWDRFDFVFLPLIQTCGLRATKQCVRRFNYRLTKSERSQQISGGL